MDGSPLSDREALNRLMAAKSWGELARFVVRRANEEKTLTVHFRRTPPKEPSKAGQGDKPAQPSH